MNIIITSEHRVGSRWLHYLLAELYDMNTSPELDAKRLDEESAIKEIRDRFKQDRIVKFHHALAEDIFSHLQPIDYKVIGVVRNPRDRAVSFAFHNRYHRNDYPFPQKSSPNDAEAVKFTVMDDPAFKEGTARQLSLMIPGCSTRNFVHYKGNYIWTAYEWMKEDNLFEISRINEFLEGNVSERRLLNVVNNHAFKNKSKGRSPGVEVRKDLWRRKGVVGDYENWFDDEMLEYTRKDFSDYLDILDKEG